MDLIRSPEQMGAIARQWRSEGERIVLVPTMGCLHAGHLALISKGRRHGDRIVLSIFVNPIQFTSGKDLEAYPREFEADCRAAEKIGVDVVFAPDNDQVYPEGFQTHIEVESLTQCLCGPRRPGHFRGVTTVVFKLFMVVLPHTAVFGWKDAQQFLVLRRMVDDLNIPVKMIGVETVREPDGLAMSSRNEYLSHEERAAAPALYRGLRGLSDVAARGETKAEILLGRARREIENEPLIRLEYLEMRSLDRLEPLAELESDNTLIALAAHLGSARLIDNIRL